MPEGTGGQVCTDIYEIRIMLKSDPKYVFEVVALDASPKPERVLVSFEQINEPGKEDALAGLFKASSSRKVAVQYSPR